MYFPLNKVQAKSANCALLFDAFDIGYVFVVRFGPIHSCLVTSVNQEMHKAYLHLVTVFIISRGTTYVVFLFAVTYILLTGKLGLLKN